MRLHVALDMVINPWACEIRYLGVYVIPSPSINQSIPIFTVA